jgi:hypothetical protein
LNDFVKLFPAHDTRFPVQKLRAVADAVGIEVGKEQTEVPNLEGDDC